MQLRDTDIKGLAEAAGSRQEFWVSFLNDVDARHAAEIGVFKGAFAGRLLDDCPGIERYYMIDPWRHLDDWNKPANVKDDTFDGFYRETMDRTAAHAEKRVVLRGRTTEVVDEIPDESLDFAYVDGDHTLRGITIDLTRVYPKIRPGGWLGGDDFCRTIFQHSMDFEPTLVFPYAVYFAEAVGCPVYALPNKQFVLHKEPAAGYSFTDLTGKYTALTLQQQLRRQRRKAGGRAAAGEAAPAAAGASAPAAAAPADAPSLPRRIARAARAAGRELRR